MRGSLTPDALARVLRELAVSRKEGILHLERDSVSKRIYLKHGSIIFAGSDDEQDRLGEVLVRAGKLKPSDLELALKVMKEAGEELGKTVVKLGLASPTDIAVHALERTKSIIRSVFSWSSGSFYFEERKVEVDEEIALDLSTVETILDAARAIDNIDLVRRGLGDLKAVLRQPANPLLPCEGSASSSLDWILYQANGVSTIDEIVAASPLEEDKTLVSIYALELAGILEIETPEKALAARTESTKVGLDTKASTPSSSTFSTASAQTSPKTLGRYEVKKVLGRGAMGAVYLAKDPTIDRTVAIKLIQTAVQLSPSELEKYRERFYREAKAAGKLLHPGIVTVFDVGHTEGATPFIVMEYVEGRTLQDILKTEKLQHQDILRLAVKILEPLAYAHSNGIVHRDIKPANILVTSDDAVKVMDFGIAHVVGSDLTQADDVLGSPNYMAPEQLSKGQIDARTDLFAFGVMLYRILTGRLPFTGDSFAAIAKAILFDEPPPPASLNETIPEPLSRAVVRCLAKEPSLRFESASELRRALLSPIAGEQDIQATVGAVTARASQSCSPTDSAHRPHPSMRAGDPSPPRPGSSNLQARARGEADGIPGILRNRRARLAAAGGVGLVLLMLIWTFALSRGPSGTEGAPQRAAASSSDVTSGSTEVAGTAEAPEGTGRQVMSDAELYHEANVAFERGDVNASKEALETLMRRNPGFEGAPEFLVRVNQELRKHEDSRATEQASVPAPHPVSPPGEAQLLYQATVAFERGDLEVSKQQLETLLRANPSLEGASELLVKVHDEIWKKSLPISFRAKHNHRIGSCSGILTLAAWGIQYSSEDHEWEWEFRDIRLMERDGSRILNLETYVTDDAPAKVGRVLGLGTAERYKFEFRNPMRDEDWSRYRRLAR